MELTAEQKEIAYHIINSLLAGGLVFIGGLSTGRMTWETLALAAAAAAAVALTRFKEYWESQKEEYTNKGKKFITSKKAQAGLFSFIG